LRNEGFLALMMDFGIFDSEKEIRQFVQGHVIDAQDTHTQDGGRSGRARQQ
jgi:hypothetical protein